VVKPKPRRNRYPASCCRAAMAAGVQKGNFARKKQVFRGCVEIVSR
jgi:hypothetical protein